MLKIKKILLIIALLLCIFQLVVLATVIDIGSAATDRCCEADPATYINKGITATGTGKITSVEIYCVYEITGCEVAIFYVESGDNLSTRDYETVDNGNGAGVVLAGSKQTFTVDLDVEEGDYIGMYFTGGSMEIGDSGERSGIWFVEGDNIPADNVAFTPIADYVISLYGTGTDVEKGANIMFLFSDF